MNPQVRVCVSLEWLGARLCRMHKRISVDQQYLMTVYAELIHVLETDLSTAWCATSLELALAQALDVVQGPYMIIGDSESQPGLNVSRNQMQEPQMSPQPPQPPQLDLRQ